MGRPPGALRRDGSIRRRHPQDWEFRDPRFEEIDSEDDGYGQGVILDPNAYAARDARARGFVSDELYFDGYDVGQDRVSRRGLYDQAQFGDDFDSDELDYRERRGSAFQQAVRDKEEALIQSALERIARARAKGKTNVNLTQEEMEALERRRGQQPEQTPPLASPPATPAKNAKGVKASSRSNSSTNLASKTRKRGGSGLFGTNSPSPAKSNSKAKVNRKPSAERALPYPAGQAPAGVMVQGPDGTPVYAPIGYYGPPSPEFLRSQTRGSRPGSRSASKHNRRESTPPERTAEYAPYPPLRYYNPGTARPDSSGSNRSLPDEIDWYPPPPPAGRNRSASNVPYPPGYGTDYDAALLPAAQGPRRNVSGPADVRYSSLRRVPPSSPLAQRPVPAHSSHSDPAVSIVKRASGLSQQVGGSSESSESSSSGDDQGVQVEIISDPTAATGYSINRASVAAAANTPSGNEGRRRKARR